MQHIKAALVPNTDLKGGKILNGSNWTGLNSTLSRCTWEAPQTQNEVQMASKPGRTFIFTRTSIIHRCFLDNSVKKTHTHIWTEHGKCSRCFPAPLPFFLFNQFPISNKKKLPKGGKVVFKSSMKRHVQHFSFLYLPALLLLSCFPSTVANPETLLT